jgi:FtsH-binding integral membrane protein
MTLEKIRQKVREHHAKTRRQLLKTLAGPLTVIFCFALAMKQFPAQQPLLQPLFAFAFAWSLAGLYFLTKGKWSGPVPVDAGFSAGLEFCRREIERRRDYFRRVLLWSFGPVLLTIGAIILALAMVGGRRIFPNAMPFMSLVVVWIVGYLAMRAREQRKLQLEIEELLDIEKENSR